MENPSDDRPVSHRFTLKKEERLCSKKTMERLFSEGNSFLVYPFKVIYTNIDFPGNYPAKAAFAVSKRLHKKAVDRNLIKRRAREAYRLNKNLLLAGGETTKKAIVFIYVGKEILPYSPMEKAMIRILNRIQRSITPNP